MDFKEMSNNEILVHIKKLEIEHEALKAKMLKDYDNLVKLEKEFNKLNSIIVKRLKG